MTARFILGDALTVLRSMPDASVDLVLTSPPFLALRSYLPADHPDKGHEMGSEATPGEFVDALIEVIEECRRVLAPHGSLCVELGDTYSGSGGSGGDYNDGGWREGQPKVKSVHRAASSYMARGRRRWRNPEFDGGSIRDRDFDEAAGIIPARSHSRRERPGWPLNKSLSLVPEIVRFTLAYGFNPLTGRETDQWRIRNVIRWCRPNPPVGLLADKFRPATSEILVACAGASRYFDLDGVRVPFTGHAGVVLDPFAGSGTTLAVAVGHGRDAIGIDLDERNADLARERVGMFLEVEYHQAAEVGA